VALLELLLQLVEVKRLHGLARAALDPRHVLQDLSKQSIILLQPTVHNNHRIFLNNNRIILNMIISLYYYIFSTKNLQYYRHYIQYTRFTTFTFRFRTFTIFRAFTILRICAMFSNQYIYT
jgi:hypothetical protein